MFFVVDLDQWAKTIITEKEKSTEERNAEIIRANPSQFKTPSNGDGGDDGDDKDEEDKRKTPSNGDDGDDADDEDEEDKTSDEDDEKENKTDDDDVNTTSEDDDGDGQFSCTDSHMIKFILFDSKMQ